MYFIYNIYTFHKLFFLLFIYFLTLYIIIYSFEYSWQWVRNNAKLFKTQLMVLITKLYPLLWIALIMRTAVLPLVRMVRWHELTCFGDLLKNNDVLFIKKIKILFDIMRKLFYVSSVYMYCIILFFISDILYYIFCCTIYYITVYTLLYTILYYTCIVHLLTV